MVRLAGVKELFPVSTSTIYRWIEEGIFPAPHHLGPKTVAWRWGDLLAERDKRAPGVDTEKGAA